MSDSNIQTGGNLGPTPTDPNIASGVAGVDMSLAGTPVYVTAAGLLAPASAGSLVTGQLVGLLVAGVAKGERAYYRYSGPLPLTPTEVAALLDTGTTFTPGLQYYVSAQSGKLTLTPPSRGGTATTAYVGSAIGGLGIMIQVSHAFLT
jgi:hypothetical protein